MDLHKFLERLTEGWQVNATASLVLVWLFGPYTAGIGGLFCLVCLDWLTKWAVLSRQAGGFWIAWKTDVISSQGMRDGLKKIVWYGITLIVGHQLSHIRVAGFCLGDTGTEVLCAYLIVIEAKSILENLRDMGFTAAGPLVAMLGRKQNQITGEGAATSATSNAGRHPDNG
jgi:phage-related holin